VTMAAVTMAVDVKSPMVSATEMGLRIFIPPAALVDTRLV
jgi:hypothetical protein